MRAATVSVVHSDPVRAGRDAAAEMLSELGSVPEQVLLFVSSRLDPTEVLAGFTSRLPANVQIAGCSSFAEINSEEGLDQSVTAMGITGLSCTTLKVDSMMPDSRQAGRSIGAQAKELEASLLITFPDGMQGNTAEYIRGIQDILGAEFPIVGGVAAEHLAFQRTNEFYNRECCCGRDSGRCHAGHKRSVRLSARRGLAHDHQGRRPASDFGTGWPTCAANLQGLLG